MSALRQRGHPLSRTPRDDTGTSLIELLVGMMVMGVFMTIFTGAVIRMAQTATKVEAVTSSAAQVNNAFLAMDKVIRYASAISTTGKGSSGDWYVELDTVDYDDGADAHQCMQLRLDVSLKQLRFRTWTPLTASTYTGSSLTGWSKLADNVNNGTAVAGSVDQPFTTPPALPAASTGFQRLSMTLVTGTAGASSSTTSRASLDFTAYNSVARDTTNATRCQQVGRP
jgi:hypothetical protein